MIDVLDGCTASMSELLGAACRVLEDEASSPALLVTAAECLLVAINEGLAVPTKAPMLVWVWLKTIPANRSWRSTEKFGTLPNIDVREDALRVLDHEDAGDDLRDLAVAVLSGSGHAADLDDDVVVRLLDRARSTEQVQQLGRLLEAVHGARGLPTTLMRAVRDRWASSSSPAIREAAVHVASELTEPDLEFVERMLNDPNADVRIEIAQQLELGLPGGELALGIVEVRLRTERHVQTHGALLRAQAALLEGRSPRRRR